MRCTPAGGKSVGCANLVVIRCGRILQVHYLLVFTKDFGGF
jgi:hypothetical protein